MSVVMSHDEYERAHPDEAHMQAAYEQNRAAQYERAHGARDGYVPHRSFPCGGVLRVVDETEHWLTIECDANCGFETTCRPDAVRPKAVF